MGVNIFAKHATFVILILMIQLFCSQLARSPNFQSISSTVTSKFDLCVPIKTRLQSSCCLRTTGV
ncbi:hypothetical protein HanRHA438_Chr01g0012231 [Helianthus annuus]|uniref:Uncharacterized protein n=1 Tax=Helianthus annuus TaxID=4232 RepID=A0A1Y3BXI0_HELAN|nr:hypothetical protein HanXRQr2_Chr01g0011881 [Helianthus annuus]KAJ0610963.1 hypothetical protein HanHA300_Chr01g0009801 [Helianthus annuus]KAJ0626226.1 hypothetical protein HanHA89_Chr01g0010671 [Helianthus annuus]KAJ0782562.1 hypothetical protein HanLR1_Chr01g0009651 [Helianthus annuus]KAJ0947173.1 hypothetical protein HanRHA438_Chr01g0012231 [Helianthus annuus]